MENDLHSLKSGTSPKDILKNFTKIPVNLPVDFPKSPSAPIPSAVKPTEPPASSVPPASTRSNRGERPGGQSEPIGKSFPQQIFKPINSSVSAIAVPVLSGEKKIQPIIKKEPVPLPNNISDVKAERPAFRPRAYLRLGEMEILPPEARLAVQSLVTDFGTENKAVDNGLLPNVSPSSPGSYKLSDRKKISKGFGFGKILKYVLAVVAIAIVSYGIYYFLNPKSNSNLPVATEYPVPESLVPGIKQNIFTILQTGSDFDLSSSIKEYFRDINNDTTKGVSRLVIKTNNNNEIKVLSIEDLESLLKISFPLSVLNSLDKGYNLIVFKDAPTNYLRLGLVFKVNDPVALAEQLSAWEPSMFTDTEPLFLGSPVFNNPAVGFGSNDYKGASVRYLPLGSVDAALNYATDKNKKFLLMATSKDDIFFLIDSVSQ